MRARLGIATAVALALAVADLVVEGEVRANPAYAHHRTQGWMGLSFGVLLLVLLSTRLPSRLFALGAGVLAGGLLGNLGSAALHDFLIPNPFVAGDVAFNLADVSVAGRGHARRCRRDAARRPLPAPAADAHDPGAGGAVRRGPLRCGAKWLTIGLSRGSKEVVEMRLVPFVLALVVLAVTATSAGATPASPATAQNLCGVGKSIASSLQSSGAITPTAGTSVQALSAQLKASFTKIEAAEKIVLANASGSIKGHLEKVFAFDNTDLRQAEGGELEHPRLREERAVVRGAGPEAQAGSRRDPGVLRQVQVAGRG